ncbi:tetratricopeptide repeat protein [Porphyromonas circumdentaria]|uniref:Tetratricopeptide repeat-containing protein n=1 Tax=Porphyromonas circumdentaria TaxID=29524 RepID=A0A1T4MDI6_9PORP|nr:hypothetical protein [Porphyromonas circumdentaria]MBB6275807.1 hypothetical protein [Porphyromonas circumdentaria]SJZ64945.1 hypothetical protein SAMN02745171_00721 [Porphyromonas circumdentaria]
MTERYIRYFLLGLLCTLSFFNLRGQTVEEAEALTAQGAFHEADAMYHLLLEKSPNSAALRDSWAKMLMQSAQYDRAIEVLSAVRGKKKDTTLDLLAHSYYYSYRFSEAVTTIELMGGKRKVVSEEIKSLRAMAHRAAKMLEYSERIEVIDSVQIDAIHLMNFPQGKLSKEWGKFLTKRGVLADSFLFSSLYESSLGLLRFFSMQGENGDSDLFYTQKVGGDWRPTEPLTPLNTSFEEAFPILRQDGITLIFARKSPDGIGGYDLYLTRKNLDTEEFLSPTLLGMPFNSPFNDFFLIYDDLYKIGVLASDRYCPAGKVNIYTFHLNEQPQRITTNDLESKRPLAAWYPWRSTQYGE